MAKLTDRQREDLIIDALKKKDDGKSLYTQQELANTYGISKGMVNRYIKEKVNASKQITVDEIEARVNLKKIEEEKSKQFSKHEAQEVNNHIEKIVNTIMVIDTSIAKNQKLADQLQDQLEQNIQNEIEALEEETALKPEVIMAALLVIDGFSKVSTRNRMALLPKEFNPGAKDDKGKEKKKRVTISKRSDKK